MKLCSNISNCTRMVEKEGWVQFSMFYLPDSVSKEMIHTWKNKERLSWKFTRSTECCCPLCGYYIFTCRKNDRSCEFTKWTTWLRGRSTALTFTITIDTSIWPDCKMWLEIPLSSLGVTRKFQTLSSRMNYCQIKTKNNRYYSRGIKHLSILSTSSGTLSLFRVIHQTYTCNLSDKFLWLIPKLPKFNGRVICAIHPLEWPLTWCAIHWDKNDRLKHEKQNRKLCQW